MCFTFNRSFVGTLCIYCVFSFFCCFCLSLLWLYCYEIKINVIHKIMSGVEIGGKVGLRGGVSLPSAEGGSKGRDVNDVLSA